jgi:hypothetical protein
VTRRCAAALAAVVLALAAGCGSGGGGSTSTETMGTVSPPVMAASAVKGLAGDRRAVSLEDLAMDTPLPGLKDRLSTWGFEGASERELIGRTADLYRVVSRTVAFKDAAAARAYAREIAQRSPSYLGKGAKLSSMTERGRTWTVVDPPSCGCHSEQPWLIAIRASGERAFWVEAVGPGVNAALLRQVVRKAP